MQILERALGPLKTIIDKELEQSCVERSERVLADKATANSSTEERKERKQLKVRSRRRRSMRWRHVSDDDCWRQAVKSNDFLCIGSVEADGDGVSAVQGSP